MKGNTLLYLLIGGLVFIWLNNQVIASNSSPNTCPGCFF